jgi:maltose O-acetyltransferase
MITGQLYNPATPLLRQMRSTAHDRCETYNQRNVNRTSLIKTIFGKTGEICHVEPNLRVDYGTNIAVGNNFYANFDCTFLDVCPITIGENAMFGPRCQVLTPLHPLHPVERLAGREYGAAITIGDNFWAGGNVTILPGVTIGDNVVAGAGAVITKSFGDNLVIAGNPAKIIKKIEI